MCVYHHSLIHRSQSASEGPKPYNSMGNTQTYKKQYTHTHNMAQRQTHTVTNNHTHKHSIDAVMQIADKSTTHTYIQTDTYAHTTNSLLSGANAQPDTCAIHKDISASNYRFENTPWDACKRRALLKHLHDCVLLCVCVV